MPFLCLNVMAPMLLDLYKRAFATAMLAMITPQGISVHLSLV